MIAKYLHWIGLASAITLMMSCFFPWVFYADLNESFTGFYSFKNNYGKPGKFLVFVGILGLAFTLLPKVWAKRVNLFVSALGVGYAIKTYILFTSCYNAYCPQKLPGIYFMLIAAAMLLVSAIFPNVKLVPKKTG